MQTMREILDEMKLNHVKELQKNREIAALKVARKPPAQKKSLFEKTQDTTPHLNTKKVFQERVSNISKKLELVRNGIPFEFKIENEVETTQCKWCESSILKGRDYCSENCKRLYLTNNPIL